MKAARYYGKEDIRIEQIPEPTVGPGQVKIAPAFVGICGTDLHEYLGGPNFCPTSPHRLTGDMVPVTLGHELSGVVVEIGPGAEGRGLAVGQHCAVHPMLACGACPACEAGADNVCHHVGFVGLSGGSGGGGLSEAVCVSADRVFPVPDGLSLETAALVEPLAVSWHAVSAAPDVGPESSAMIIGGGPIGLTAILCLRAKGVRNIIVCEMAEARRRFASDFGASTVLNPREDDVTRTILDLTNGKGVDVAFDCAGVAASIKSACENVKTKGTVVNVAIWEKETLFNPNWLTMKESSYKSVLGYHPEDFQAVIDAIASGVIKPNKMVTRKIMLDNLVKDGIGALITDKDNHVKILVDINASLQTKL